MSDQRLALFVVGAFALASAAYAAGTPATPARTTGPAAAVTGNKTTHAASAFIAPAVPFKGVAKSFKAGAENRSLLVQSQAGEWFALAFAKECKALSGAKSLKLSQGAKSPTGRVYVGRRYCKIASFAKAAPPAL